MNKPSIDVNEKISSKNIGVVFENGKIRTCFISISENPNDQSYACYLSNLRKIDPSKVTPISEMFYEKSTPDNGPCGEMLAFIAQNDNCQIFEHLKSDKSIVLLRGLSTLEPDIHWYNEDNGVQTVKTDESKSFKIKDILKVESKVNKLEEKSNKQNLSAEVEMQ